MSSVVLLAGYIICREVEETAAFAKEDHQGQVAHAPIIEAFKYCWRDMIRVVGMAFMNVMPVVATIFGAAYAVQASYGIGFHKSLYLWIPVVGNIVAALVIPYDGILSDRIGRRIPIMVGAHRPVCFHSGICTRSAFTTCRSRSSCRYSCEAWFIKGITRSFPATTRNSSQPVHASRPWQSRRTRHDHHHTASGALYCRRSAWTEQYSTHCRVHHFRPDDHLRAGRVERTRDVSCATG